MRFQFDDLPAAERRLRILAFCAADEGLRVNCESGFSSEDADMKWLLRKCYIELRRTRPGSLSRATKAYATTSGVAAQVSGKL